MHLANIAIVLTTLTSAALAAPSTAPNLPKEVHAMHRMAGTWSAKNVQIMMGGKKTKGEIAMTCSATAGGFGVSCQTKITVEGMGVFEETDLFGYDPHSNRYHWFAVTSMGDTHDHVALPPTEKEPSLVFAYSGFQDSKPMQELLRLTFAKDGKNVDFRNDGTIGGQTAWTVVATLTKK